MKSKFQIHVSVLLLLMFVSFLLWCIAAVAHDPLSAQPRSPKWPAARAKHLLAHPVCEVCGHNKDLEVHHIMPYHLKPELELDPKNFITLGVKCPTGNHHFLFGHLGSWQSYNKDVVADAAAWRKKIKERP